MSLKGKTLFITGASRGIGLAIALRTARDGANIAIAAKTEPGRTGHHRLFAFQLRHWGYAARTPCQDCGGIVARALFHRTASRRSRMAAIFCRSKLTGMSPPLRHREIRLRYSLA